MRYIFLVALVFFLASPVWGAQTPRSGENLTATYSPGIVYSGKYESTRLYRLQDADGYIMEKVDPTFLGEVICGPARRALRSRGEWRGELESDGSCGPLGDPHHWVTGNYLNYLTAAKNALEGGESD